MFACFYIFFKKHLWKSEEKEEEWVGGGMEVGGLCKVSIKCDMIQLLRKLNTIIFVNFFI